MKHNIRVSMIVSSGVQILHEGKTDIQNDHFYYYEKGTGAFTGIWILENGMRIERRAEDSSYLLVQKEKSSLRIQTAQGELEIPNVKFLSYQRTDKQIELCYEIEEKRCLRIEYR